MCVCACIKHGQSHEKFMHRSTTFSVSRRNSISCSGFWLFKSLVAVNFSACLLRSSVMMAFISFDLFRQIYDYGSGADPLVAVSSLYVHSTKQTQLNARCVQVSTSLKKLEKNSCFLREKKSEFWSMSPETEHSSLPKYWVGDFGCGQSFVLFLGLFRNSDWNSIFFETRSGI